MGDFHLETERLIIRNWKETDRDLFHLINFDEQVMAFFPFRRDRVQSDAMMDDLKARIRVDGYGFTAIALKDGGAAIGFCGLANAKLEDAFPEEAIEIGWRLAPTYWGKGYATEAAERLIKFGFETLNLDEIVSFAVADNIRSTAIMKRIGMVRQAERDFDHPRVPDTHPHLVRHVVYAISRSDWKRLH